MIIGDLHYEGETFLLKNRFYFCHTNSYNVMLKLHETDVCITKVNTNHTAWPVMEQERETKKVL